MLTAMIRTVQISPVITKVLRLSDKGRVENVFQYQASEIHNSDYKKNVNKSTEKVISNMLQNAVQAERFFHKKTVSSAVASII